MREPTRSKQGEKSTGEATLSTRKARFSFLRKPFREMVSQQLWMGGPRPLLQPRGKMCEPDPRLGWERRSLVWLAMSSQGCLLLFPAAPLAHGPPHLTSRLLPSFLPPTLSSHRFGRGDFSNHNFDHVVLLPATLPWHPFLLSRIQFPSQKALDQLTLLTSLVLSCTASCSVDSTTQSCPSCPRQACFTPGPALASPSLGAAPHSRWLPTSSFSSVTFPQVLLELQGPDVD